MPTRRKALSRFQKCKYTPHGHRKLKIGVALVSIAALRIIGVVFWGLPFKTSPKCVIFTPSLLCPQNLRLSIYCSSAKSGYFMTYPPFCSDIIYESPLYLWHCGASLESTLSCFLCPKQTADGRGRRAQRQSEKMPEVEERRAHFVTRGCKMGA